MKFKRAIILLLCVLLTFSLVACNKTSSTTGNNTPNNPVDPNNPNNPNVPVETCRVTFVVGDEAAAAGVPNPEPAKVNKNDKLETLPSPTWEGHSFIGWFRSNGVQFKAGTRVGEDLVLTAQWAVESGYDKQAAQWSQAGHLYLHYKRFDHTEADEGKVNASAAPNYDKPIGSSTVYDDWGLWIWAKNDEGRLFYPMKIDESGAVYDVLLDHDYNDGGWDADTKTHKSQTINYKTAQGKPVVEVGTQLFSVKSRLEAGFWANDGGNNYLVLSDIVRENGSYHWFVVEGSVTKGERVYVEKVMVNPYKDDVNRDKHASLTNVVSTADNSSTYPVTSVKGWEDVGVGYQIFVASFKDSDGDGMGDLRGIIEELDYLKKLNVGVLWLTPFQTSTNYHGYDIKDWYSVDSRFGTTADYRELVYKAHQKGIRVVMDFVLNHTASSNPWFVKSQNLVVETDEKGNEIDYRNFYNWITEKTYNGLSPNKRKQWYKDNYGYYFYSSFSSDQPELNYDYQPVRDAILDVAEYWMSFGLDGFRLDAVKHIYMENETPGRTGGTIVKDTNELYNYNLTRNLNFYREFNYRLKQAYPNAYVVGENLDGDSKRTAPFYDGIDSQFNFHLYYNISRSISIAGNTSGQAGWVYTINAQYKEGLTNYTTLSKNKGIIDGVFTSNHDLPRARDRMTINNYDGATYQDKYQKMLTEGTLATRSGELLYLYYAVNMTLPGISWIYYGDEIGMSGIMQTLVNGKNSSESTPHEDRIYRQPMKWYNDVSKNSHYRIGFEDYECKLEGINATKAVPGVDVQDADKNSLLNWMRLLTSIRTDKATYGDIINGTVTFDESYWNSHSGTLKYDIGKISVYINAGDVYNNKDTIQTTGGTVVASHRGVKITKK